MIYKPEKGAMWDPSVLWHDGYYYAIMMYNPDFVPDRDTVLDPKCGLLARSPDGVHWSDWKIPCYELYHEYGADFFKAFIGKIGDRFVMDHGVFFVNQNILRFYESKDLADWTYIGSSYPDSRWYRFEGRWDHMYIIPKDEEDPSRGYWGFPVATPKEGLKRGFGMMETIDGIHWDILPPADVEWGDVPPHDFEVGGVERIGEKYVMIGGGRPVSNGGYTICVMVADRPEGPYFPDKETYILCGSSDKRTTSQVPWASVTALAAWGRGKDNEKLISNYAGTDTGVWLLPMRKPVFSDGHLRLGWWENNERLMGEVIRGVESKVELTEGSDREVYWLSGDFDRRRGVIVEGTLRANPHGDKCGAGFVIEEADYPWMNLRRGLDIRIEVGDREKCRALTGRWSAVTGLTIVDVVGKGHASVRNLEPRKEHGFKLLVRHDLYELYIDDLLVQTYQFEVDYDHTGIGLMAYNCEVIFSSLKYYYMDLD